METTKVEVEFGGISENNVYFAIDEKPGKMEVEKFLREVRKKDSNIWNYLHNQLTPSRMGGEISGFAKLSNFIEMVLGDSNQAFYALWKLLPEGVHITQKFAEDFIKCMIDLFEASTTDARYSVKMSSAQV